MSQAHPPSEPVTLVISEIVPPDRIEAYEAWARGINQALRQVKGFMAVEVLRPRDNAYAEYVVIVRFDTYTNLRHWVNSPLYRHWIDQSRGLIVSRSVRHMTGGMEVWFSLPHHASSQPLLQPPYYKKVILGVLAVYPLILLANAVLGPFLAGLPPLLGLLISVTFVSALLTYPVMPWLTKALEFWLYPE